MPIVLFLGNNTEEYSSKTKDGLCITKEKIKALIKEGQLLCKLCLDSMALHSSYPRGIKETGEEIQIYVVWCSKCKVWHALLPDFLLAYKHYSGNEIEAVIIESATVVTVTQIETEASESTVRRWIKQVGESIRGAVGKLRSLFGQEGKVVSETKIEPGSCYSELEQILELAPSQIKCCGNKLGMANIWLGKNVIPAFI